MPKSPKRPCRYRGCPNLTDDKTGYCDDHKAIARRKYDKYERSPNVRKQYGHSWEKIRNKYIMLHPLCEQCLLEGKSKLAEEVHHKIPVKQGGTHDVMNLIALCKSCHNKIHHDIGDR